MIHLRLRRKPQISENELIGIVIKVKAKDSLKARVYCLRDELKKLGVDVEVKPSPTLNNDQKVPQSTT